MLESAALKAYLGRCDQVEFEGKQWVRLSDAWFAKKAPKKKSRSSGARAKGAATAEDPAETGTAEPGHAYLL